MTKYVDLTKNNLYIGNYYFSYVFFIQTRHIYLLEVLRVQQIKLIHFVSNLEFHNNGRTLFFHKSSLEGLKERQNFGFKSEFSWLKNVWNHFYHSFFFQRTKIWQQLLLLNCTILLINEGLIIENPKVLSLIKRKNLSGKTMWISLSRWSLRTSKIFTLMCINCIINHSPRYSSNIQW